MKKLLFITPKIESTIQSGGIQVTQERLAGLGSCFDLTVLTLSPSSTPIGTESGLKIYSSGELRQRSIPGLFKSYKEGLPLSVWRNSPSELIHKAKSLANQEWDLIYVDHWLMWEAARLIPAKKHILHLHNAEPELFFRAADQLPVFQSVASNIEGWRAAAYIRQILTEIQELHLLSSSDEEALRSRNINHPVTRVFLPKVRAAHSTSPPQASSSMQALFVGSLSWLPNLQGMQWFRREVLQNVRSDIKIVVAGGGANDQFKRDFEACRSVQLLGYVDDVDPLYEQSRCLIAPLLSGSGIKIKIVNALSHGLPVVTTSLGVEGFPTDWAGSLLVADEPKRFSDCIEHFMGDPGIWRASSAEALAYSEKYFGGHEWLSWCRFEASQVHLDQVGA